MAQNHLHLRKGDHNQEEDDLSIDFQYRRCPVQPPGEVDACAHASWLPVPVQHGASEVCITLSVIVKTLVCKKQQQTFVEHHRKSRGEGTLAVCP